MFNFLKRNKTAALPKVRKRQPKVFIDNKVEQYTRSLQSKGMGLIGDRLDDSLSKDLIHGSINRAIKSSASRLYDQGRTLALNSSIGARYCQHVTDSVVGTGLDPKPMITDKNGKLDEKLNKTIEGVFWAWAGSQKRFSRNGRFNFRELLAICERERIMGGECFVVLHEDKNEINVSVLSADKCDWSLNQKATDETTIVNGIEYDNETLRPVAYYFRKYDLLTQSFTGKNYRVEASKVLHYFNPTTAEQMRGITDFLPVIKDIAHQEAFRETVIIHKRIAASSMAFIEKPKETGDGFDMGDDDFNYQPPAIVHDFEPGTIQELEAGSTIKSIQSNQSGDDFDKFNDAMLTSISMGLGCFKQGLSGDTSQINYSAARFGSLMEGNRFKGLQNRLIEVVIMPLYEAFLRHAVIHSKINIRMTQIDNIVLNTTVIRPKVESVDPLKDINAQVTLINNGLKSRSAVILERGDDPEQVFSEISAEKTNINIPVTSDESENSQPQPE
ncbi:phage portal protein [Providencia sp. JUb39]|uniref:phage portal protein n=1 Tax=Providencia sp. JUb39 TaxID=2724165 RepID=UPI00164D644A|nr:phage portal protein [Providencia sp. JUb39]MBC5790615.1 phage portal protein [Providencia sp. JUb39]